ncbi:MAG: DUF362 domain-containing protein [Gemmatimonadetes bacterium]|nr:DUF362 domain-containing protein [Gemmatimonadota bacterium]
MEKGPSGLTRRDFVKGMGLAAAGGVVRLPEPAAGSEAGSEAGGVQPTSKVVLVRDQNVLSEDGAIDPEGIQEMLDQAMTRLFGMDSPEDCWKHIIEPDDVVGIKTNIWRFLPTPSEVEDAIKRGVTAAGVPEENIGMGDQNVLRLEIFERTTALINSRPMRTHAWSGVGSLIKNYIMFDHPPDYHDDACADLAKLWELPIVKGKTRLNVLVMLTPQFHNIGPHHFDPEYTWPYKGIIVSTDPVAADAVGLRIIQAKRQESFGEDRPLQPTAHHIELAETVHKLGVADMERIDLVRLGWAGEELI